jgi:sugar lactone lactonase YvrE
MRRSLLLLTVLVAVAAPAALAKGAFPKTIALPPGFQPEGIAVGTGNTFYVGSIPTGAIYAGDLRTGTGDVLIQGAAGRAATGLKYDRGRLFVSGAGTGKAFVYDTKTLALIREYQLAPAGSGATFINDVVVTHDAAYFTDSNRAVIYSVALGKGGAPGEATTIPLTGDFQLAAGFNLNGIDASSNGRTLFAIQSVTGKLFTIDPTTGATKLVDLGGATLTNGDGILLQGKTLYVVRNSNNQVAVVQLSSDFTSGKVVRTITDPGFDVPTTIALKGDSLYAVNARFGTASGPNATYTVVKIKR